MDRCTSKRMSRLAPEVVATSGRWWRRQTGAPEVAGAHAAASAVGRCTGSVGPRTTAAVGGRQVHIEEIESTGTGRRRRRPGGGGGGGVRQVHRKRRRLVGGRRGEIKESD